MVRRGLPSIGGALASVLLLLASGPVARADRLALDWVGDGILLPLSIGLAGTGEYVAATAPTPSLAPPDIAQVDALDRLAILPYSRGFDVASTVLEYTAIAAPLALMVGMRGPQIAPALVVTAEALFLAEGTKSFLKALIPRYRPYVYSGGAPADTSDREQSFPSGHSTMSFAGASVASAIFATYWPESPLRVPFTVAAYGIAATTAAFRVLAGMHFITDVATGALIGTACGVGVTLLHRRPEQPATSPGLSFSVGGQGLLVRYRF